MKVNIEFDTQSKELTLNMDGKKVKNVDYVSFVSFGMETGEFEMLVETADRSKREDEGITTRTVIHASEQNGAFANLTETPDQALVIERLGRAILS
jgi:hypothetical protein